MDAKEEFARDYVAPAIRANARYQGGYPLFTSLGRPLLAKLACDAAREHGADTIAHGCTGKGNDQVRIEATVATLAPDLKVIAPVREWQMGRDEEIAYAQEHGIPVASTVERPYSIDDNLWGRSSEGGVIEDLDQPPPEDVFQLVTPPDRGRPTAPRTSSSASATACPSSLDGEELGLVELIRRVAEAARAQRRRDRRPHRGPRRGAEGARHLRGPRGRDHPHRPPGAREAGLHRARERAEAASSTRSGPSSPTRGSGTSRSSPTSTRFMEQVNRRVEGEITMRLYKGSATAVTAQLAERDLRPQHGHLQRRRLLLAGRGARASSSSSRSRAAWPTESREARERG